jgi:hypothetical protein
MSSHHKIHLSRGLHSTIGYPLQARGVARSDRASPREVRRQRVPAPGEDVADPCNARITADCEAATAAAARVTAERERANAAAARSRAERQAAVARAMRGRAEIQARGSRLVHARVPKRRTGSLLGRKSTLAGREQCGYGT